MMMRSQGEASATLATRAFSKLVMDKPLARMTMAFSAEATSKFASS